MTVTLRRTAFVAAALALGAAAAAALGQGGPGYGPGPGPGFGPGMMGGFGPGYGPGMMGGGPGFGPGRGYGAGRGDGYGYGPGFHLLESVNLSDEQREKILAIQEENRQKSWGAMGQLRTEMFKLRRLYYADAVDPNAVAEQQKKVDELRRQMLKSRLESRKQVEAVLTDEQRKQFREFRPWWLQEAD